MILRVTMIAVLLVSVLASRGRAQTTEPATGLTKPSAEAPPLPEAQSESENPKQELAKLDPTTALPQVNERLTVIDLEHLDANGAAAMLQSVFKPSELTIAADQRGQSLLIRGDASLLQEVEKLIRRLDERGAPSQPQSDTPELSAPLLPPALNPVATDRPSDMSNAMRQLFQSWMATEAAADSSARPRPSVDALRSELRKTEAQAQRTAKLLRSRAGSKQRYEAETNDLRQQVARAFHLRQALERAELRQFLDRLLQISQTIELREGIASEIIDRRVKELLEPTSSSAADASDKPATALAKASQPTAVAATPELSPREVTAAPRPSSCLRVRLINGPRQIQWISGSGAQTDGQTVDLLLGQRCQFRATGLGGRPNLRAFASVEVAQPSPKTEVVVSTNAAVLALTNDDLDKLEAGEVLTYIFWLPNDLTEADENLIMVATDPAGLAERGTVVAVLRMAVDAKKVLTAAEMQSGR